MQDAEQRRWQRWRLLCWPDYIIYLCAETLVLDFVGLMSVCLLLLYFSQNFLKEPFVNKCNLSATHCVRSSWRVSHYSGRIFTIRHRDVNICVFWNKVKKRGLVIQNLSSHSFSALTSARQKPIVVNLSHLSKTAHAQMHYGEMEALLLSKNRRIF